MLGTRATEDVNVWHKSWLKHSPADTIEGKQLHLVCKAHNLKQLALSSLGSAVSAVVVPGIADHKGVLATVALPIPKVHVVERTVWEFKRQIGIA